MAVGTDELEALRDELIRTRARGARVVHYDGRRVEYGSDAELAAAISDLDRRIANATANQPRSLRITSSKGI